MKESRSSATARGVLAEAARRLEDAGSPSARLDAEILLAHCLRCDRLDFLKNPERRLSESERTTYEGLVARRLRGEPVAYLTGRKAFWTLTLEVGPDVLIPRPDTEVLVEEALAVCRLAGLAGPRILDVGTGSGAIALALAAELPGAQIVATDISAAALAVARRNARALGLAGGVTFLEGDLLGPVEGLFDLIVSNPPYIGAAEYETLPAGIKNYEPRQALWAGQTGVEFYEKLIYQAPGSLREKGWLLLEIGAQQSRPVGDILARAGFYEDITIRADYAGLSRVIRGRRK
ncbi:MAG: peptide chain release factor N(5)-glutamine methyltransferase [Smithellaceae bacterium]|nr:peptide chain release factor N(5)-glutamine methyltransferase [Smithellaceae bacterium]